MPALTSAASFTPLGPLGGVSVAIDISADGGVVVGQNAQGIFRWTSGAGVVGLSGLSRPEMLGLLPDRPHYQATGISADGRVVVGLGQGTPVPSGEAFRWTSDTGKVDLGDLPGSNVWSAAHGVSADGSVVVGFGSSASTGTNWLSGHEAFRWTGGTGMVGLGDLPGGDSVSEAHSVSADGSVVVGFGSSASSASTGIISLSGREAFRWTGGTGMVGLGDLPGGDFGSEAYGVSADGSVVVGVGSGAAGREAFRWTSDGGMVSLGDLPGGTNSMAFDVSADGRVVVGSGAMVPVMNGQMAIFGEAFIWTEADGMQRLLDVLLANGATGLDGWTLVQATGISADGRRVVGWGYRDNGNHDDDPLAPDFTNFDDDLFAPLFSAVAFTADLTPVPVPGAAWLFGSAFGALFLRRRKVV